jgi:RNAse (barnase) inhibitor barstar
MSHLDLAAIVGRSEHNGVYRLVEGLAVADAIVVSGRHLHGKPAMLEALAEALAFPDWFGGNWDALEDCLTDLSWLDGGVTLLIDSADLPEAVAPEAWDVLLDILADAARYWHGQGRPFSVLLQGGHAAYPMVAV